ncbi:MAG: hypothetical protein GVY35_18475, partial [Bacteroidetes bacterium]|nr:hypothetical protein [Bacteroidota bacterium]
MDTMLPRAERIAYRGLLRRDASYAGERSEIKAAICEVNGRLAPGLSSRPCWDIWAHRVGDRDVFLAFHDPTGMTWFGYSAQELADRIRYAHTGR